MRILVTFAVENEFAPWRRMRGFRRAAPTEPSLFEARIGTAKVCVVLTGIGPQHARRALQIALANGANICVATGLAGALQSRHRIGDVLVAQSVRAASGESFVTSDAELLHAASACGAREVNAFQSSDRAVLTAKDKGRLAFFADAVEMEGFTVLSEAHGLRVPAVAIRAIGDTACQDLPLDFNRTVGPNGQISIPRVFGQLLRNPHRLPGLVRLGRDTQRAATRLAKFLDSYVEMLAAVRRPEGVHEEVAVG
jgi:adenosylhomocysteine nucleosidase